MNKSLYFALVTTITLVICSGSTLRALSVQEVQNFRRSTTFDLVSAKNIPSNGNSGLPPMEVVSSKFASRKFEVQDGRDKYERLYQQSSPNQSTIDDITWEAPITISSSEGDFPQLSIDSSDRLLISWRFCSSTPTGDLTCNAYLRRSVNLGTTWDEQNLIRGESSQMPGPHALLAAKDNTIHVAWSAYESVSITSSSDGGLNFTSEARLDDGTGLSYNYEMRPDLASDAAGNIYAVWAYYKTDTCCPYPEGIYFAKSTNGGSSFSPMVRVDDIPSPGGRRLAQLPSISVATNGTIYVVWADYRNDSDSSKVNVHFTKSTDGGLTFETSKRVNSVPDTINMTLKPALEAYGKDLVYVVWTDNREGSYNVYFARSDDGGTSFEADVKLNDNVAGQSMDLSALAVGPTGQIMASWFDTRNTNDYSTGGDIYTTVSTDGGVTFSPNSRVNSIIGSAACCGWGSSVPAFDSEGRIHIVWVSQFPFTSQYSRGSFIKSCSNKSLGNCENPAVKMRLPFKPLGSHSANGLDSIYSWFDHKYPLLPRSIFGLSGKEPTLLGIGDTVIRYDGDEKPDCPISPIPGYYCYSGHNGYDFSYDTPEGTQVFAATSGKVQTSVDKDPKTGNIKCVGYSVHITTDDGLYQTRYLHLDSDVITESHVSAGDLIGTVGPKYPCTGGPHLHFSVYFDANGDQTFSTEELVDPYGFTKDKPDPWTQEFEDLDGKKRQGTSSEWLWEFDPPSTTSLRADEVSSLRTTSGINLLIPKGAVNGSASLNYTVAPDPVSGSNALTIKTFAATWLPTSSEATSFTLSVGHVFRLTAAYTVGQPITDLSVPAELTVKYSDNEVTTVSQDNITIYLWDEIGMRWLPLESVVDTTIQQVKANITKMGLYSLRGTPLFQAPSVVEISPNLASNYLPITVTITGSNFISPTFVNLDVASLQVISTTSTTVMAVVPAGLLPKLYDIRFENADGQIAFSTGGYTILTQTFVPLIVRS